MRKYTFLFSFVLWLLIVAFSGFPENFKTTVFGVSVIFFFLYLAFRFSVKHLRQINVPGGTFVDSKKVLDQDDNTGEEIK